MTAEIDLCPGKLPLQRITLPFVEGVNGNAGSSAEHDDAGTRGRSKAGDGRGGDRRCLALIRENHFRSVAIDISLLAPACVSSKRVTSFTLHATPVFTRIRDTRRLTGMPSGRSSGVAACQAWGKNSWRN